MQATAAVNGTAASALSLKRCRSPSSSPPVVASTCSNSSDASASVKCDDGARSATECRSTSVPSSLTMKDLLNDDMCFGAAVMQEHKHPEQVHANREAEKVDANASDWSRITVSTTQLDDNHEKLEATTHAPQQQQSTGTELDQKCRRLAELITKSKHLVAFTGAGISTSVGLPDYRGDNGIRTKGYEKQKRRKVAPSSSTQRGGSTSSSDSESGNAAIPDFHSLVPSKTHMALYELHRLGYLKHLVSQNVDNLHLKSGVPASALTEVHGNATQAKCETCEKIYTQDFPWTGLCDDPACVSTKRSVEQRLRARTRHGNGRLKRNVISFDEPLDDIDNAIDECEAADVALVLGTSLRVEPFSEMAGEFAESLVIVNLQPTTQKLDRRAETSGVRLFEKCDVVMEKTMKFLLGAQYEIPEWTGAHPTSVFIPEHEEKSLVNVLAGRLLS